MRIHPVTRQIAHGIAGDGVYVDGDLVAPGGGQNGMPDWLDGSPIWCGQTGKPFQFVRGSQVGAWAGWTSAGGVVTSWGLTLPEAVLLDMAPDGTLLVGDDYQSGQGISAYRPGDTMRLWGITSARPEMRFPYSQAAILDAQTACWTENVNGRMVLMGFGLPPGPRPPWTVLHPRLFRVNGDVWVVYLRAEDDRTIAHPWDYLGVGFSVPGFGFGPEAWSDGSTVTLCWSVGAGEVAGDIRRKAFDLSALEVIPSVPPAPAVTPLAPNVASFALCGTWWANDAAPGNAAIGSPRYTAPRHPFVIAEDKYIDQIPAERRGGLLVYLDLDIAPNDDAVRAILERSIAFAAARRVPMFIYDDARNGRFDLVKQACGDAPWIWMPMWFVMPGEDPAAFAREVIALARTRGGQPFVPAIRAVTGLNNLDPNNIFDMVPEPVVVAAFNELITQDGLKVPGCLGPTFFAFDRGDGILNRPLVKSAIDLWMAVPTTITDARAWAQSRYPEPRMPETIPTAVQATMNTMAATYLLPQNDPEAVKVWSRRMAEQVAFSHNTATEEWGLKSTSPGSPVSNNLTRRNGSKIDTWDYITGSAGPTPKLNIAGAEHFDVSAKPDGTPAQNFISVSPVNHLEDQKPRPGRAPWPAAVKHGVSGFDVAARVKGGDFSYYDLTAPLPLNVFVYTTIDNPQTHRLGRTFVEGLAQTETLLKKLTADNRQAMFIMVCGPHTVNNGPKPTRAEILDMVRQQVALFSRYPKAVLAVSLGNELFQGFEPSELLEPSFQSEVDAIVPLQFPFAIGQVSETVVFGPGSVAMMHPDRGKSSLEALQILADAQTRDGRTVVAREPKRIEAGGSGQASGDLNFVREELENAKRLNLPYFLHLAAGRGAYVPALDDVQRQALALIKAAAGTVPPPPPGDPVLDVDFRRLENGVYNPGMLSDAGYLLYVNNWAALKAAIIAWGTKATGIAPAESDINQIVLRLLVERDRQENGVFIFNTPRAAMMNKWPTGAPA